MSDRRLSRFINPVTVYLFLFIYNLICFLSS